MDLTVKLAEYIYVLEIKVRQRTSPGWSASAARGQTLPEGESGTRTGASTTPPGSPFPPATNPALAQIRARDYSAKYRGLPGRGLFELGLVFDSQDRNLVQADWQALC